MSKSSKIKSLINEVRPNALWDIFKYIVFGALAMLGVLVTIIVQRLRSIPSDFLGVLILFFIWVVVVVITYIFGKLWDKREAKKSKDIEPLPQVQNDVEKRIDALNAQHTSEIEKYSSQIKRLQENNTALEYDIDLRRQELEQYAWLHEIARIQANNISQYIRIERVVMIDPHDPTPSINFYFYVSNKSNYHITIDDKIEGAVQFEGQPLTYPLTVLGNDLKEFPPLEVGMLTIKQPLRIEEADRISKFGDNAPYYYSLDYLNITIRGGKDFPHVAPQRLLTKDKKPERPEAQQSSEKLPITDVDVQRSVFTYAGVMFQELQSEHHVNFFIRVFNGFPCKMKIVEQAEGFILLDNKALPTRPQFSVSTDSLNDRKIAIDLVQGIDEDLASAISDKLNKGEQLSFSFEALHVYGMIEGKRYRLKLPDGLICKKGITYSTAIYGKASL